MKILTITAAMTLSACGTADTNDIAQGDPAFKARSVDGVLQPVAARAVMVGSEGRDADACGALGSPLSDTVAVHWSNAADSPVKTDAPGEIWVCQTDGAWAGIVFPADGQSTSDCDVGSPVTSPREYQGPCRWGWVESAKIAVTAG